MDVITLNPAETGEPFEHNFNKVIGSGHLGLALYERTLRHLEMARRDLGVRYLRCHGLLNNWPDLCSWANQSKAGLDPDLGFDPDQLTGEGEILANYAFIDLVFDRLLEIGIRPFVEIGFMPRLLASSTHTITRWNAHTSPPRDYKLWSDLIEGLVRHWARRYGLSEISQWYFEVWNEPNLEGFWPASLEEYFKLYAHTVSAVKAVNGGLRVGGPATAGRKNAHLDEFLRFCHETNAPVDFVTAHSYSARSSFRKGEFAYHEMDDPAFLTRRFEQMRKEIDDSPIPGLPLHITEYNSTTSSREVIHDLPFNAAYLGRTLSEAGRHADSFSYWAVSDVFVEEGIPPAEFHGGFGMINIHDIPKPTYHLFHFFRQLGTQILSQTENSLFTRRDDGHVVGVMWNPNNRVAESQQRTCRLELPDDGTTYVARTLLVDETHANPYRAWQLMGRHRNPSRDQLALLHESARPACRHDALSKRDGKACLDVTLDKNACLLVDLIPVEDHTSAYHGLDQAFYDNFSIE